MDHLHTEPSSGPTVNVEKSKLYNESDLVGKPNIGNIQINHILTKCLIDTGSVISSMSYQFYQEYCADLELHDISELIPEGLRLHGASGKLLNFKGFVEVKVSYPGSNGEIMVLLLVLETTDFSFQCPILIGTNLLSYGKQELKKNNVDLCNLENSWGKGYSNLVEDPDFIGLVRNVDHSQVIQAESECLVYGKVKVKPCDHKRHVILTPLSKCHIPRSVECLPVLFVIPEHKRVVTVPMRIRNLTSTSQTILPNVPVYCASRLVWSHELVPLETSELTEEDREFLLKFNLEETDITEAQLSRFRRLLCSYKDVFAMSDKDLGCCDIGSHKIELSDNEPFKEKYRRIPPSMYEAVKQHLQNMLDIGVIRESQSPWCSTVTIAMKKDLTPRVCVDYRRLNSCTKRDSQPLPRIDETLDTLAGSSLFSCLDLLSGYHQIEMDPESIEKTAFTAGPLGFYEWCRLPFGLMNSGATFQRSMERVLKDLLHRDCLVYIDDVLVYSSDFESHMVKLAKVFQKFREHGLRLKPKKCVFLRQETTYLGHQISAKGISKDPKKLGEIDNWPVPTSVKELRRFLGFTGYFRKFVKGYALRARPLTNLLVGYSNRKGARGRNKHLEKSKWCWLPEHQQAFDDLRSVLKEDVVLAYADFTKDFVLEVDACLNGLGAVLGQEVNGVFRPIAFASRRTSRAEQHYPIYKLEFLALKWAVVDKFKDYLFNQSFKVYTDSNPLAYILKNAKLDATSARWCAALSNYNFTVHFRSGKSNKAADALSRLYDGEEDQDQSDLHDWAQKVFCGVESGVVSAVIQNGISPHTNVLEHLLYRSVVSEPDEVECFVGDTVASVLQEPEVSHMLSSSSISKVFTVTDWSEKQDQDPDIKVVKDLVKCGEFVSQQELKTLSKFSKLLLKHRRRLFVQNGVLYRKRQFDDGPVKQIVLPVSCQSLVFQMYHDRSGHLGESRTVDLIQRRFFWFGMRDYVRSKLRVCERCIRRKKLPAKNRTPLGQLKDPIGPFDIVSMDFLSVDSRKDSKFKVLTVVDEFTRFAFAFPVTSENATSTAKTLYKNVFSLFGFPSTVHSDNGGAFVSKVLKEMYQVTGTKQTTTVSHCPTGNSTVERLNQSVLNMLGTLSLEQKSHWKDFLPSVMYAYNSTVHESTGYSPFYLMFCRNPRLPVDIILGVESMDGMDEISYSDYVRKVREDLRRAYKHSMTNSRVHKLKHKENYDSKTKSLTESLKESDIVLLKKMYRLSKIEDRWEEIPYQVLGQPDKNIPVYRVKPLGGGKVKTVHRNSLLPFLARSEPEPDPIPVPRMEKVAKPVSIAESSESEESEYEDAEFELIPIRDNGNLPLQEQIEEQDAESNSESLSEAEAETDEDPEQMEEDLSLSSDSLQDLPVARRSGRERRPPDRLQYT